MHVRKLLQKKKLRKSLQQNLEVGKEEKFCKNLSISMKEEKFCNKTP